MYNEISLHIDQNGHIENPTTIKSAEGVKQREPTYTDAGSGNWEQPLEDTRQVP